MTITPEKDKNHTAVTPSKYNIMLIWAPDTQERVQKVQKILIENLEEEVSMQIVPFKKFSNSAWDPILPDSVRGKHVYVYVDVESEYNNLEMRADMNSRYMFARGILNDVKLYGAKTINVVFPMYPYARSDKWEKVWMEHTQKRKPIYAQMVAADMRNHGIDYLITLDIHNPATLSFYGGEKNDPIAINIPHSWVIQQWLKKHNLTNNFEIWSTDAGGTDKLQRLLEDMKVNGYVAFKSRDFAQANKVDKLFIYPWFAQITWKDIVVYDDMIDTAWTLETAVMEIQKHKPKSIIIISTHGLFNGAAIQKLQNLYDTKQIEAIYITDSVYRENLPEFIHVMWTENIIARQIARKAQGQLLDPNWGGIE